MRLRIPITVICWSCIALPWLDTVAERQVEAAIEIDDFSASTNDRFADDPAFIGGDYDFSGVGRTTNSRWATLIAPNIFLTAQHFPPATDQSVFFYRDNDPTSTAIVRTVVGGQQLLDSDLRIGYFDLPLPISITAYTFLQIPLTTDNFESTLKNEFALQLGNSPTASDYGADTRTNLAVGQNRLELFTPEASEDGVTGDVLSLIHNEKDDPGFDYEQYEAELNSRDSGSPVFTVSGVELQVAGIAWAKGDFEFDFDPLPGTDQELIVERVGSVYTYTGNLASQIHDYIDQFGVPRLPGDYNANGFVDTGDYTVWQDHLGSTTQLDADGNRNGVIDVSDYDIWWVNMAEVQDRLPGDYNANGFVEIGDFTVWQDHLGSTTQLDADGNRNGVIDGFDYDIWRAHFGIEPTNLDGLLPVPVGSAVPEPALQWLLGSCGLGLVALRQFVLSRVQPR